MTTNTPTSGRQLRSLVKPDGTLELSLTTVEVPAPEPDEVIVRVDAAPINPSDIGALLAGADLTTATVSGSGDAPVLTATIPAPQMKVAAGRVGESMPVGNEGAGVVVDAGSSDAAQALLGQTVALFRGAMYAQYRTAEASQCLVLPEGTLPADGASCFVNPLTALGMVETMHLEHHHGLVHTAAASNLGQMLNKLCLEDGIPLVNIVRKPEQEQLLRAAGARYVCDSSAPGFLADLTAALTATSATLAFDAIGGGRLAGDILACMEAAAVANATEYSRYGSNTYKHLYIYGGLDRNPTVLERGFGMAWGMGGWLLPPFLSKIGPDATERLRQRVVAGLKTIFASTYTKEISLAEVLGLEALSGYGKQATGEKYLIFPNR